MASVEDLISSGKYWEAADLLDGQLAQKQDAQLYYFRSIVSARLKNYEYAHEMIERAISMKKDPEYLKFKGLMLFETLDFRGAFAVLEEMLEQKKDVEAYFICFLCLMFLEDERSRQYLKLAFAADKAKAKLMLNDFYIKFFKNSRFLDDKTKKQLEAKLKKIN